MELSANRKIAIVVTVLIGLAGIGSAVTLFTQSQPAVPSSQMTANCLTTAPLPASVPLGGDGEITFSCNAAQPTISPAFTTSDTILVTPTLTGWGAPYADLYIYDADGATNTGPCGLRTAANLISAGGSESIPAGGWNYCARYQDVGPDGLATFDVTWTS